MRKAVVVIVLLLFLPCVALSEETKLKFKVYVDVSGDEKIKNITEQCISKGLRSFYDVVITDIDPDFIISILADQMEYSMELPGPIVHVIIVERNISDRILPYLNTKLFFEAYKEKSADVLNSMKIKEYSALYYSKAKDLEKNCEEMVIYFDKNVLNKYRKK